MKKVLFLSIIAAAQMSFASTDILNTNLADFSDLESLKGLTIITKSNISQNSLKSSGLEADSNIFRSLCDITSPVFAKGSQEYHSEMDLLIPKYGQDKSGGLSQNEWDALNASDEGKLITAKLKALYDMTLMPAGSKYKVVKVDGKFSRSKKASPFESLAVAPDYSSDQPRVRISLTLEGSEGQVSVSCSSEGSDYGDAKVPYEEAKSVMNLFFTK